MPVKVGLGNASQKLAGLKFDPIEKMVEQYGRLMAEIEIQEQIQAGTFTRLRLDGKPKAYSPDFHMELVDKAAALAEKLMKYGYAPAKDDSTEEKLRPILQIGLSNGGTFTLGGGGSDG